MKNTLQLYHNKQVIGLVDKISQEGAWYLGKLKRINFPKQLEELFQEYEALANDQVFALLDELEDKIAVWDLKLGNEKIYAIQVMNEDDIAFKRNQ